MPAPWSALLLFSALCLQGCSLLPRGEDSESTGSAPTPAIAESGKPSFAVQVNAPANVRETLDIVDRACIIYGGQVLFAGSPQELVADENVRRLYLGESFTL